MVDCTKNLYEILNVSPHASFDEIKLAYKKLVRIYHPDVNKSFDSEIKFKLLNNAYEILSDAEKRKNYDSLFDFGNLKTAEIVKQKDELINNEEKQEKQKIYPDENSIIKEIKITEKEARMGTSRVVNVLNTQICPKCLGRKFLSGIKCAFCLGEGEKKELKKIEVNIDKDIKTGDFVYVGKINSSALYDKNLFLKILVEPPQKMYFEGNAVIVKIKVPVYDAILGASKEINIEPLGLVNVEIPPLSKPETRIKIETSDDDIEYYATIDVIFPENISNEEKRLYDRIRTINALQKNDHNSQNKRNI